MEDTSSIWPATSERAKDKEAFLFSLSKKQKYNIINQENVIGVINERYISFGCGNDLYLYNKLNTEGGGTYKVSYDIPGIYDLNGGNNRFKVSNYEIYQIDF